MKQIFPKYNFLETNVEKGSLAIITINRPDFRNAVNTVTAIELFNAFQIFDQEESLSVAILRGAGGNFCAGADLKEVAGGVNSNPENFKKRFNDYGMGPMGPSKMVLKKPVIAAVEGFAVAGKNKP